MGKKLELDWVTDIIGEDYKTWKNGDVITVEAQTGTGKTHFVINTLINYMLNYEKMIYICNRVGLKRQIIIQLLKKYNMDIPMKDEKVDLEELDKIETIKNITVTLYHNIANTIMFNKYMNASYTLDCYNYIICDECHFFFTDAGFYNKSIYAFNELIKDRHRMSKTVYISATMEEVKAAILRAYDINKEKGFGTYVDFKLHEYSTGIDYSYLDIKYFNNIKNIVQLIKNDTTEDKWLIFVASKGKGKYVKNELLDAGISSVFIEAGSKNDEVKNIIDNSKFDCKVLVSTKVLDNGVNIKDDSVKNLVISTYDKTTFIQEIGRLRVDIMNAHQVNLYIDTMSKKGFSGKLDKVYNEKQKSINLFNTNIDKFKLKYNNDMNEVYHDIFYLDKDNNWKINPVGKFRLRKDIKFANEMLELFEIEKMSYIYKQLKWINMQDTYNINNLIEDVFDTLSIDELNKFLESAYENNERFTKDYFIECIDNIINSDDRLKVTFNNLDGRKNRTKGQKKYNELFKKICLDYRVGSISPKEYVDGKRKTVTYWIITRED